RRPGRMEHHRAHAAAAVRSGARHAVPAGARPAGAVPGHRRRRVRTAGGCQVSIRVLAPGLASAIQAGPRSGLRHLGVAGAGALDPYSHAVANLLVGNAPGTPALEITLAGPRLRFEHPALIALCGADIDAEAGGSALPGWRPLLLPAGAELALGRCRRGARAYLAVAGGFEVAEVLGSASTDLATGFGGFAGRCLLEGDVLALGQGEETGIDGIHATSWWLDPAPELDFGASPLSVRILPGGDAARPP